MQFALDGGVRTIPLMLQGVTSCFTTRKPSLAEYENDNIPKIHLAAESPDWDPHSPEYSKLESSYFDGIGRFKHIGDL